MKMFPGETAGLSIPELKARLVSLRSLPSTISNRQDLIDDAEDSLAFLRRVAALRAGQNSKGTPAA